MKRRYIVGVERIEKLRYNADVPVDASSEQEAGMLAMEDAERGVASWGRPRLLDEFVNVTGIEAQQ